MPSSILKLEPGNDKIFQGKYIIRKNDNPVKFQLILKVEDSDNHNFEIFISLSGQEYTKIGVLEASTINQEKIGINELSEQLQSYLDGYFNPI
nr:MAG TPA: hypothetical protein [Caudoviricetes sp.]